VISRLGYHLIAWTCLSSNSDLIAESAGGSEESRFLSNKFRDMSFKSSYGRVVAKAIVSYLRLAHRPAHIGRRLSYRVAS
jgi:hypothetical protein